MASPKWTIYQAIQAALAAIPAFAGGAASVVIRKRPFYSKDHDTLPLVCISGLTESIIKEYMSNGVWFAYPFLVTLLTKGDAAIQSAADIQWEEDRRFDIWQALFKPRLTDTSAINCVYDPAPPFDSVGLDNFLNISIQQFTYTSDEHRSA